MPFTKKKKKRHTSRTYTKYLSYFFQTLAGDISSPTPPPPLQKRDALPWMAPIEIWAAHELGSAEHCWCPPRALSNANPALGHKEVRMPTDHIVVTTRYSNRQGSKSRQIPCPAREPTSLKNAPRILPFRRSSLPLVGRKQTVFRPQLFSQKSHGSRL